MALREAENRSSVFGKEVHATRLILIAQMLGIAGGIVGFIGLSMAYRALTSQRGAAGNGIATRIPTKE